MLTLTGLGAPTTAQIQLFKDALTGCAIFGEKEAIVAKIKQMLPAFPDAADRLAIQRALLEYIGNDSKCQSAIAEAFAPVKKDEVSYNWVANWFRFESLVVGGASLVVGGLFGFFIGRRKR